MTALNYFRECGPIVSTEVLPVSDTAVSWRSRLANRKWPLAMTAIMLLLGMLFMFLWIPVMYHKPMWDVGADLWGIFRGAHYVGWGFIGGVYTPGTGVITFPGIAVLLAPIAIVSGPLHLSESYAPYFIPHPTVALILQPLEILLASSVLFSADALAQRLELAPRRRAALCVVLSIIVFPVGAVWGHAEDAVAVAFAIYALVAVLDGKWSRCGWLLGVGIVMQPLVALTLPLFVGFVPGGKRLLLACRSAALSAVLVGVAFIGNPADAYHALVSQPTPPSANHATPWVGLAPKLTSNVNYVSQTVHGIVRSGHVYFAAATANSQSLSLVAGGPGRSIDVLVAVLFGLYVWRRPPNPARLVWLVAVVLASRCFFEAVMTPYYVAPPLILALVIAARHNRRRFWAAALVSVAITVFAYFHFGPWEWWVPIVVGLCGLMWLSCPDGTTDRPGVLAEESADRTLTVARLDEQLEPVH